MSLSFSSLDYDGYDAVDEAVLADALAAALPTGLVAADDVRSSACSRSRRARRRRRRLEDAESAATETARVALNLASPAAAGDRAHVEALDAGLAAALSSGALEAEIARGRRAATLALRT